jgi:hypothetical protein
MKAEERDDIVNVAENLCIYCDIGTLALESRDFLA